MILFICGGTFNLRYFITRWDFTRFTDAWNIVFREWIITGNKYWVPALNLSLFLVLYFRLETSKKNQSKWLKFFKKFFALCYVSHLTNVSNFLFASHMGRLNNTKRTKKVILGSNLCYNFNTVSGNIYEVKKLRATLITKWGLANFTLYTSCQN